MLSSLNICRKQEVLIFAIWFSIKCLIMSLLNPDRTSEANVKAIAKIPSHIVISLISLIFCGLTGIGGILCGGTTGIIAIVYAVLTFTAKKNLDYEVAMRYSQIAKIWAIAAYIAGVFCLFALLID